MMRSGWLGLVALLLGGCVHVYQPMAGLQQPVVVDTRSPNLGDVRVTVRCFPGELLNDHEAGSLCDKVGTLFELQGAQVTVATDLREPMDGPPQAAEEDDPVDWIDLIVELRARELHRSNDPIRWAICAVTYTLVPAVTEATFTQEVVVKDGSGFLLASESMTGRLVRYFGLGAWVGNAVLNLMVRDRQDRIFPGTASEDLTNDMYRQLSQTVYNAKVQAGLLREASPEAAR
ncbi:MAG: hypothetical protein H6739_15685 [Alphaproteobacteria bacterium]|nr:hypothetical protein [Alphaproteobacteria bacterium]